MKRIAAKMGAKIVERLRDVAHGFVKKEIDLVLKPSDGSGCFAIELKCPRRGRVPETMCDACRDLKFLEQLIAAGFRGGLFVMHVADRAFYEAALQTGIYSFFPAGVALTGTIVKPTGVRDTPWEAANDADDCPRDATSRGKAFAA